MHTSRRHKVPLHAKAFTSCEVQPNRLFLSLPRRGRKNHNVVLDVITLARRMLAGPRHMCSGTLTAPPCQALSHHLPGRFRLSPPFFFFFFSHPLEEADSADGSGTSDQKSATFILKLSRRPGGGWFKREMTENSNREKKQRTPKEKKKERGWGCWLGWWKGS